MDEKLNSELAEMVKQMIKNWKRFIATFISLVLAACIFFAMLLSEKYWNEISLWPLYLLLMFYLVLILFFTASWFSSEVEERKRKLLKLGIRALKGFVAVLYIKKILSYHQVMRFEFLAIQNRLLR